MIEQAFFIKMGLTKDRWPFITKESIQHYIDNPDELDSLPEEFVRGFWFYYDWWDRENKPQASVA